MGGEGDVALFGVDIQAGFFDGVPMNDFIDLIEADVMAILSAADDPSRLIVVTAAGFTFSNHFKNGREVIIGSRRSRDAAPFDKSSKATV